MKNEKFAAKQLEMMKHPRIFILEQITELSAEQQNRIPAGFNNNIVWNIAHLIWAEQDVCYRRAGLQITVDDKYFTPYRTGARPASFIDEKEIDNIKQLLINTIDQLAADVERGILVIDEAMLGLTFHDWLHAGYIIALKRLVK